MSKKSELPPSDFWRRLAQCWGEHGLPTTQNGVAGELGMKGNGTTGRWYRGDGYPEIDTLIDIARRGKVTVDWLLTGDPPKGRQKQGSLLFRFLIAWDGLSEVGREHVLESTEGQLLRHPADDPPAGAVVRPKSR